MVSCGLNATGGQCPVVPACHFCDLKLSSLLARTGQVLSPVASLERRYSGLLLCCFLLRPQGFLLHQLLQFLQQDKIGYDRHSFEHVRQWRKKNSTDRFVDCRHPENKKSAESAKFFDWNNLVCLHVACVLVGFVFGFRLSIQVLHK